MREKEGMEGFKNKITVTNVCRGLSMKKRDNDSECEGDGRVEASVPLNHSFWPRRNQLCTIDILSYRMWPIVTMCVPLVPK